MTSSEMARLGLELSAMCLVGDGDEALARCEAYLAGVEPGSAEELDGLNLKAHLQIQRGRYEAAEATVRQSLARAETSQRADAIASSLLNPSRLLYARGEIERAGREAVALARDWEDRLDAAHAALAWSCAGGEGEIDGEPILPRARHERALALALQSGDPGAVHQVFSSFFAFLSWTERDDEAALALLDEWRRMEIEHHGEASQAVAGVLEELAFYQVSRERPEAAESAAAEAIAAIEAAVDAGVAEARMALRSREARARVFEDLAALYDRRALEERQRVAAQVAELDGKASEAYRFAVGAVARGLARTYQHLDGTLRLQEEVTRAMEEEAGGPEHTAWLKALADYHTEWGCLDPAERTLRELLALQEATLQPEDEAIAATLESLAWLLDRMGRNDEAAELFARVGAPNAGDSGIVLERLAEHALERGDREEALRLFGQALDAKRGAFQSAATAATLALRVAGLLREEGRDDEAETIWRELFETAEQRFPGPWSHGLLLQWESLRGLAVNDLPSLAWVYRFELRAADRLLHDADPLFPELLRGAIEVCRTLGRDEEAATLEARLDALPPSGEL